MYYNNIIETVGYTPLVRLNQIPKDTKGTVLAKIESNNPGNANKDRIAVKMVEDAEKEGLLKPGGTIIEGTSGNTGMGLALVGCAKGYKCICTVPDKQSKEKIDLLKAVGAEVIVTPTAVAPDDPKSYYSVAKKLNEVIPNSFYPNQYYNYSNTVAHYETTGPEIWEQTEGKITHFVCGVGTGGTISGAGKYLKEQNPNIKIWGIDPYGSVFKKYHEKGEFDENEMYPYLTEGIGEDIIPSNVDFSLIDYFEKVSDKEGYIMTRRIAKEEGILAGNSSGSVLAGFLKVQQYLSEDDLAVILFPDHATRYVGKAFNDEWMRERGFIESDSMAADEIVKNKQDGDLITLHHQDSVSDAIRKMRDINISQLPVVDDHQDLVGSVTESSLYSILLDNPDTKHLTLENIMDNPFPIVSKDASYKELSRMLDQDNSAVIISYPDGRRTIITKYDILQALSK